MTHLLAIIIPNNFSAKIAAKAKSVAGKALNTFGLDGGKIDSLNSVLPLDLYYKPVLQEQFRRSIQGALYSALQLVESKPDTTPTCTFQLMKKPITCQTGK